MCVSVGERTPEHLLLTRTYTNKQLKATTESDDVGIAGMCMSADGGRTLLLADYENNTVKAFDMSCGSICTLYKETDAWKLSNVCMAAQTDSTQSLILTEHNKSDAYSKRLVVADREGAAANFTRTYEIAWKGEYNVREWRITSPPTRTNPPHHHPCLPSLWSSISDTPSMTPFSSLN